MTHPTGTLARINVDSADCLAEAYGILPAIAARIVEYRKNHGPFFSPEDLAQVEGFDTDRARELAPLTDWIIPTNEDLVDFPPGWLVGAWLGYVLLFCISLGLVLILFVLNNRLKMFGIEFLPPAWIEWVRQQGRILLPWGCLLIPAPPFLIGGVYAIYDYFRSRGTKRPAPKKFQPDWSLVKINTAPTEIIAGLPGVGVERAATIVKWRDFHDWFRTPSSIAVIPTIGPELANHMAACIAWSVPQLDSGFFARDEASPGGVRSGIYTLSYFLPAVIFWWQLAFIAYTFPMESSDWPYVSPPYVWMLGTAWILSDLGVCAGVLGMILTARAGGFQPWRINRTAHLATFCYTFTLLVWLAALVIGAGARVLDDPGLWSAGLNRQMLNALCWWLVPALYVAPYLAQVFSPRLRFTGLVQYIADFAIFSTAVLTLFQALDTRFAIWAGFLGLFYVVIGVRAVFFGKSFYGPVEPPEPSAAEHPNESEVIDRFERTFPSDAERQIIINHEITRTRLKRVRGSLYTAVATIGFYLIVNAIVPGVIQFFLERVLRSLFP